MSHQDWKSEDINHVAIKQAVDELFPSVLFRSMKFRSGSRWKPRLLATAAFVCGCLSEGPLERRFELARSIAGKLFRWFPAPGKTYEGFKKSLLSHHQEIKLLLMENWRERMKLLPAPWTVEGYLIVGVDGSRVELPRTRAHEDRYAPSRKSNRKSKGGRPRKGKRRTRRRKKTTSAVSKAKRASTDKKCSSPQLWLTLIWHIGTGLPWDWKVGPSDSSERQHLREMLDRLPENALITADAGFVGYDFWKSILDSNRSFVIRAGGNVKLLRRLGYAREDGQTVYLWPDKAMKQKQPPLPLRLIELREGKERVYLVTNLPKSKLTDQQAERVYRARWGIELFFRTFKQTFQCRKLRSHKPEYAELELDWKLLSLWGMLLTGQQELCENKVPIHRQSPAQTIRAFQKAMTDYRVRPATARESLRAGLRSALLDEYERTADKSSRNYPRQKQRQRTVPPKIKTATRRQTTAAQELRKNQPKIQLAA